MANARYRLDQKRGGWDLTIICREKTFKVHLVSLSRRSTRFSSYFGEFEYSKNLEINLSEHDPAVVEKYLGFVCLCDFDCLSESENWYRYCKLQLLTCCCQCKADVELLS